MWLKQMYEFALDADLVSVSPVPTGHLKSFLQPETRHFPAVTNAGEVAPLRALRQREPTLFPHWSAGDD